MNPIRIVIGLAAVAVVGLGAVYAVQQLRSDDPDFATEAPQLPVDSASGIDERAPTPASSSSTNSDARHFVIDSSQSTAKYVVEETLRGIASALAVGTTKDITGDIYLTRDGLDASQKSSFKVDLRTLRSDESQRDNFIRQNTLQTSRFPFAEFTIDSVDGFPAEYTENEQVNLKLTGTMTIHGVSKPVTFDVLARQKESALGATARATFKFTDFGMSPPNVQVAQARDSIEIEVVFVALEATS